MLTSTSLCGCDLLEKSYLCGVNNNLNLHCNRTTTVVICLKNRTFVVSITTYDELSMIKDSCDLLEKSYLCGVNNNTLRICLISLKVVICLKNRTFVVSITTVVSSVY